MQSFPYLECLAYLKELEKNIQRKTSGKENTEKTLDIIRLILGLQTYKGTNEDIQQLLLDEKLLELDEKGGIKISVTGMIFLKKNSKFFGYTELLLNEYPMLSQSILSVLAIVISIIALIISA